MSSSAWSIQPFERDVAASQLGDAGPPFVHHPAGARCRAHVGARRRGGDLGPAVDQRRSAGRRATSARRQRHLEADAAVGVHRGARGPVGADAERAVEIPVAVGVDQRLRPHRDHSLVIRPRRTMLSPLTSNTSAKSLRITSSRLKRTGLGPWLVMSKSSCTPPSICRPITRLSVRGRDLAVLGRDGPVGEVDARQVVGRRAAVQQVPSHAVGVDRPGADHPRVEEIQAHRRRPSDLPVRLGDQHRVARVDGKLRRADLDLERHARLPGADGANHRRPGRRRKAQPGSNVIDTPFMQ